MTKKISPTLTLLALAVSAFAIGSTEFISVGLIPMLIQSFHVSLAQAGLTVSVYALGIMVGAPLMTLLTGQMNRHTLMLMIMGLFIAGNLLAALAPTFSILLAGRVVAALAHGIFMTVASVIAADVVAPAKRASAIAVMFTGLTVATVTGVSLGNHDWATGRLAVVLYLYQRDWRDRTCCRLHLNSTPVTVTKSRNG